MTRQCQFPSIHPSFPFLPFSSLFFRQPLRSPASPHPLTRHICIWQEAALTAVNPHVFTMATLTGHAVRAYGAGYFAAMDNGPARAHTCAQRIAQRGLEWGDPGELSTVRREDFEFVKKTYLTEDVLQSNNAASTNTSRGHQFPAAFLTIARCVVCGLWCVVCEGGGNSFPSPLPPPPSLLSLFLCLLCVCGCLLLPLPSLPPRSFSAFHPLCLRSSTSSKSTPLPWLNAAQRA